jgi:hypothetical protein
VRAALELEDAERAVALDGEGVRAVAHLHRLGREAAPLGVLGEHPVQVGGPEAGLLTAGAAADLDDDVLVVVGVALDHREADLLVELLQARAGAGRLLAHLGVVALGQQLLGAVEVGLRVAPLLGELRGGLEVAVRAPHGRVALAVGDHLGVAHVPLGVAEARLDLLDELLDHRLPV